MNLNLPQRLQNSRLLMVTIALIVAVAAWLTFLRPSSTQEFTVYFTEATKLHTGDKITVLDVKVGRVLSVTPQDDRVRVRIEVDSDQKVPQDARATIVAPTMISIRRIELSPAYGGGPALAEGASIPLSRTAVPVEWDEVQTQLTRLAIALGPKGNSNGALGNLVTSAEANLEGQGAKLGETLISMAEALQTLSDNRGEVFATVRNLDVFVEALASSDETVRLFNSQLSKVSGQLSSESETLVGALDNLGKALKDLDGFVEENRSSTTKTLTDLQGLTRNLADHRQHIADILQSAPIALSNYYNIYYPDARAMTGTFVGQNLDSPAVFICSSLYSLGGTPSQCEKLLDPIAKFLKIPVSPIGINPLERNGGSGAVPTTPAPSADSSPLELAPGSNNLDLLGGLMLGLAP